MIIKSFISFLTAMITLLVSVANQPVPIIEQVKAKDFAPVVRFMVCSDTHINGENDPQRERLEKAVNFCYTVASEDEYYNNLDAVMFAGDCTNGGTDDQFDAFGETVTNAVKGNTKILAVVAKNHDGYEGQQHARSRIEAITGLDADFNVTINGFHFIGISASPSEGVRYTTKQKTWLKSQLKEAKKEDSKKPIFVINHEHVSDTVYGSRTNEGWGVSDFKKIFGNYSQVVSFTGHSHYPVNDPRSVWQGDFTAFGTGSMSYMELTVDSDKTVHPDNCWAAAQCLLVEVDANNQVRVRGIDVTNGAFISDVLITEPSNTDTYAYTPANQEALSTAPVFPENASLTATKTDDGYDITAPAAVDTDGKEIFVYRITVTNTLGTVTHKEYLVNNYWSVTPFEEATFHIDAKAGYSVSVVAENMYELQTAPLTCTLA